VAERRFDEGGRKLTFLETTRNPYRDEESFGLSAFQNGERSRLCEEGMLLRDSQRGIEEVDVLIWERKAQIEER